MIAARSRRRRKEAASVRLMRILGRILIFTILGVVILLGIRFGRDFVEIAGSFAETVIAGTAENSSDDTAAAAVADSSSELAAGTLEIFGQTLSTAQFDGLTANDEKVYNALTAYYQAKTERDTDTCAVLDPQTDADGLLEYMDNHSIVGYQNVNTWSKSGLSDGSYFVYVTYEVLLDGVDTPLPSLSWVYLDTDENGSLYMENSATDSSIAGFITLSRESDGAQELITFAQNAYEDARSNDASLDAFLEESAA